MRYSARSSGVSSSPGQEGSFPVLPAQRTVTAGRDHAKRQRFTVTATLHAQQAVEKSQARLSSHEGPWGSALRQFVRGLGFEPIQRGRGDQLTA